MENTLMCWLYALTTLKAKTESHLHCGGIIELNISLELSNPVYIQLVSDDTQTVSAVMLLLLQYDSGKQTVR
jgi:hypothetical protein